MPIGYGYQERGDAGYVNWAAVTKGFTDVLDADIKDKKKREQEYQDQDRKIGQTLDDMPLGQFEDGNTFTGNAVDMIKKQKLMDYKLWKAGKLSDKQYTLKQNNMTDNINTLFDLQKTYQAEAEKRMKGLQDQSLQPLTANNMAMIEGFSNFKDSVPMIDPQTNVVSIVRKVYDEKTKTWNIDKTKSMPVKMAMGLIMKPADAFKVNEQIDQDVARMGSLKDSLYKAATKYGAGSIEELIGPEGFTKYPGAKGVIENYNKAINQQIESYLTPGLNLTSVLTMQVGGYNANSFTYDKAEAAKDPSKILMKIDPTSKYPTIDETGPNFKKQKEQAADWIKTQFMSRIDRERNIQAATGQLSDVGFQRQVYGEQKKEEKLDAATFGKNLARYATGTPEEASAASSYLTRLNIPNYKDQDGTIHIMFKGQDIPYDPKKVDINKYLESLVSAGNEFFTANNIRQGDVVAAAKAEAKGKRYSAGAVGAPITPSQAAGYSEQAFNDYLDKNVKGSGPRGIKADRTIIPNDGAKTATNLNAKFGKMNLRFESKSGGMFGNDFIKIKNAAGGDLSDWIDLGDQQNILNIKDIIKSNVDPTTLPSAFPASSQPATSSTGGGSLNATARAKQQQGTLGGILATD